MAVKLNEKDFVELAEILYACCTTYNKKIQNIEASMSILTNEEYFDGEDSAEFKKVFKESREALEEYGKKMDAVLKFIEKTCAENKVDVTRFKQTAEEAGKDVNSFKDKVNTFGKK